MTAIGESGHSLLVLFLPRFFELFLTVVSLLRETDRHGGLDLADHAMVGMIIIISQSEVMGV